MRHWAANVCVVHDTTTTEATTEFVVNRATDSVVEAPMNPMKWLGRPWTGAGL
jgi:hypothetical protein